MTLPAEWRASQGHNVKEVADPFAWLSRCSEFVRLVWNNRVHGDCFAPVPYMNKLGTQFARPRAHGNNTYRGKECWRKFG